MARHGKKRKARKARKLDVGEAALRGALAGLAGGAALMVMRRLEDKRYRHRRLLPPTAPSDLEWGDIAARAGRRAGRRLSARQRSAAGVGMHLAYSALIGAALGVLRSRADAMPSTLPDIIEDTLLFAAGAPRHRLLPRRAQRRTGRAKPLLPVEGTNIFGAATSAAFRALLKV